MIGNNAQLIRVTAIFVPLLFITGIYCVIATRNLVRTLIGLEVLSKGVTLLLVVGGYLTGRTAFSQACIITLITLEAVVLAVASGIIINAFQHTDSLDTRTLQNLRG
jgi:NADH:ubiquinone oxidoreductase subunit K